MKTNHNESHSSDFEDESFSTAQSSSSQESFNSAILIPANDLPGWGTTNREKEKIIHKRRFSDY